MKTGRHVDIKIGQKNVNKLNQSHSYAHTHPGTRLSVSE